LFTQVVQLLLSHTQTDRNLAKY